MEHLQPYIGTIVEALVGLFVVFVLGVVSMLRVKIATWLETRTTAQQRDILHRLAQEGFALAENMYREAGGTERFNEALAYVQSRVDRYGIKLSRADLTAAIEKAVLDYNAKVKGTAANDRS